MRALKLVVAILVAVNFLVGCESAGRVGKGQVPEVLPLKENFGQGWEFKRIEPASTDWEQVSLPHTARIEPLVVNDQWQGTSLYRKWFPVDSIGSEKWFLDFEGVMQEAKVYINDSLATVHKGGYLPFRVDATPFLVEGIENLIQVEVINTDNGNIPPGKPLGNLDFNYYGGIYRNVYLVKKNPIYITNAVAAGVVNGGGLLIRFDSIGAEAARGIVKTHIRNESDDIKSVSLNYSFTDEQGKTQSFSSTEQKLRAGEGLSVTREINIQDPVFWCPENPHLYDLQVEVMIDGEMVDRRNLRTGIRDIELIGDSFYLNGKERFLNGTNRHQEYPYLGYALSDEAQYRDAYKIKQAGFDFVRLSHYPQATAFLDACDELGIMVMNCLPGWQYFEEGEFAENALQDIRDMVRRDRNHPSMVFWENSLNESAMTEEFIVEANEVLKAELPYEDTYSAGWIDHPAYDLFTPARQHAQPPAYWNDYDKRERPIFIAEYGDWGYYAQNAGFNQKAFQDLKAAERSSRQLRSAGEKGLLQQALNFQESFNSNLKGEQTIGQANWLMFDYNRGYSDDLEASGISDIFRLPKFSYYFYQSQEAPFSDEFSEPMVFIASYWTPESATAVRVFSNTQEVALYLNGELIERKKPQPDGFSDELAFPPFTFDLGNFQEGKLKAVGYIDGKEVAAHTVATPGDASQLELSVDLSGKSIATDHPDMVFIYARILDENGTLVPTAENEVSLSVEGEQAEIIGGTRVKAEAGIATILLKTEEFEHPIVLKASSAALGETELRISNH